jgi:hypothetical protein
MALKRLNGGRSQLVTEALEAFKQNDTSSFIDKFSRLSSLTRKKANLSIVKPNQPEGDKSFPHP